MCTSFSANEGRSADNRFGGAVAREVFGPDANGLGKDLDKYCRHHETGSERHQVCKEALAKSVRT